MNISKLDRESARRVDTSFARAVTAAVARRSVLVISDKGGRHREGYTSANPTVFRSPACGLSVFLRSPGLEARDSAGLARQKKMEGLEVGSSKERPKRMAFFFGFERGLYVRQSV